MALDSISSPAGGAGANPGPLSISHTTVAASTTLLVFACLDGVAPAVSATCAATGLTFTQLGSDVASGTGGTSGILRVWQATAVAAGTHAITITCATANDITGGSIAYVTTGLGTPVTNAASANGTTSYITVPTTTSGNTICAFIGAGNAITATTGPATSRVGFATSGTLGNLMGGGGAAGGNAACSDSPSTGSAVTVTWSCASTVAATFAVEVGATPGGQRERMPQQLSRITKHRRGASQRPQFNQQLPYVTIPVTPIAATSSVPVPAVTVGKPYIAGVAGTPGAGWFVDQANNPRLWVASETWGLPVNAGRWSGSGGGTWQQDYDNFFAARAGQGVTVMMTDPFQSSNDSSSGAPNLNGNTWDGYSPWVNGTDASGGLLSTFWARIDYMMASALANGITVGFTLNIAYDTGPSGTPFYNWSNAQFTAYGAAVGTRYKNQPNIVWLFGNDNYQGNYDSQMSAFLTALRTAGANQLGGLAWWEAEYTSRYETDNNAALTWGGSNSPVDFCYTYNCGYWVIEYAYGEVINQGASTLLPVIWGDGSFYNGGAGGGYSSTYDRAYRQETWWTLASGARGILSESEAVFPWSSGSCVTAVTTTWQWNNNLPYICAYFQSLPEWYKLIPDLSSAFVTAGRGTRIAGKASGGGGGSYEPAFTNSWVAASITPDGNLAICYLPNHTTITCTTSMLTAGWTATWVDPVSCATSSAGAGPTFNSTAKGTNSQGDPDWVLVFRPATGGTGTASIAGAGSASAVVTQAAIATAAGAGSVTAKAAVIAAGAGAGAGTTTAVATQAAPGSSAGTGAVADVVTQIATATAGAAGASATAVTQAVTASAAGAGAVTAAVAYTGAAVAAGTGAATAVIAQGAIATAAGAGSVTAVGASSGAATAAAAGTGAATAYATQAATATGAGTGADTALATQGAGAALAGAGTAGPAPVTQAAASAPAGTSAVTGAATQTATAQAAGAGAVTAIGSSSGAATGTAAGTGSATALAAQGATSAAAGAGTIAATPAQAAPGTAAGAGAASAVATQAATAAAAGAGSVTAAGGIAGGGYAAITGAGAVTAVAGQAVTGTATGAGQASAAAAQGAKSSAAGAGSVTAAGQITGTGSAAGAGSATAKAAQGAVATPAGAATLTALAAQQATAALTAAGGTAAAWTIQLAFTVGTLTATDSAGAGGTLTASDTRTGGPA